MPVKSIAFSFDVINEVVADISVTIEIGLTSKILV